MEQNTGLDAGGLDDLAELRSCSFRYDVLRLQVVSQDRFIDKSLNNATALMDAYLFECD